MFQGASSISLDAKGRMVIPARHRDALSLQCDGRVTLTRHHTRLSFVLSASCMGGPSGKDCCMADVCPCLATDFSGKCFGCGNRFCRKNSDFTGVASGSGADKRCDVVGDGQSF